ncbi:ricin-type beta-trefoil lectin protein [Orenia metallireducens]|nr:RICIN domain-containing protein [Orenia metallireducens]PRX34840.1 ricin-type beta-trefoil lectin protein [Orenia metallireducens]
MACKTADGTVDGEGNVIGDSSRDYRNSAGRILEGPEYLTIFEGISGKALVTTDYLPARGTVSDWGDSYGNRVDRFLATPAYLDGQRPSLVMARGYYTRMVLVAWDWRDGQLTKRWTFDSNNNPAYYGQGDHDISVCDVDFDGRDEIIYGSAAIDDDGTGLYSTGSGHGDALHLSDMNPDRDGYEIWQVHEEHPDSALRDAATGLTIFSLPASSDVGRGMASDIDPRYKGYELWSSASGGVYSVTGSKITSSMPASINFGIWWDGDLLRELLDGDKLDKWDYNNGRSNRLKTLYLSPYNGAKNNGTKANPCLSADILGDWREEILIRTADNTKLNIITTTALTNHRIYTLMHNRKYRLSIAWQNVGYNQPPHPDYYLGQGMSTPTMPDIYLVDFEGYYKIENRNVSNMYIDGMGRTTDGSDVGQYSGSISFNQQWEVIHATGPYYKLKNRSTGLFLDGMGQTANGSIASQWSSSPSYNQQWEIINLGNGYYQFKNRYSGMMLDGAGTTTDGASLKQWSVSSHYNQQWKLYKQ